jgi:hypothetical protein
MVEYDDENERRIMLAKLLGIDKAVWVQVEGFDKVRPISNEDLERETEDKTSAVHFMRFELTADMCAAARAGKLISAGIDHPEYQVKITVPEAIRQSLVNDLA